MRGAVLETRPRADNDAPTRQAGPCRIEGNAAECYHDLHADERVPLGIEMNPAAGDLGWRGLVIRWRAPHRCRDERLVQPQPIVDPLRCRHVGEAVVVQRSHQEIARAAATVAGEHASRAVGAMGGRRQAKDQDSGERVTESRHRTTPVGIASERGSLLPRDALTVRAQAGAAIAGHDLLVDEKQAVAGYELWVVDAGVWVMGFGA
jgi:hypothetical protein